MIICGQCEKENHEWAAFCRFCGNPLEKNMPDTQPLVSPEQTEIETPVVPDESLASDTPDQAQFDLEEPARAVEQQDESQEAPPAQVVQSGEADEDPNRTQKLVYLDEAEQPIEQPPVEEAQTAPELVDEFATAELLALTEEDERSAEPEQPAALDEINLEQGALLLGRYRLGDIVAQHEDERVFVADDLLQCWNCSAQQSQIEADFCQDCGAELLQYPQALLYARPITEGAPPPEDPQEWLVETGFLVRLEPLTGEDEAEEETTPGLRYQVGYFSHAGQERDVDEDSLLVMQLAAVNEAVHAPILGLYAIADGMGGHESGEVASRVAIQSLGVGVMEQIFTPEFNGESASVDEISSRLQTVILKANQAIIGLREQHENPEVQMGCTLSAVLVYGAVAIVANVGDSRTYHMRDGQLTQVTRDHSVVARMVEQGLLEPEQIFMHEQKSVVYRSLGDKADLEIDLFVLDLKIGDRLLLCCDGLWEMVRDSFIEEALLQHFDPQSAAEKLVDLANLSGGEDNISVIVLDVGAYG